MNKNHLISPINKSMKEDHEALEALIERLRSGEINAFYYGPAKDPDYEHSLLVERITEKGENGKTTYEYTWTKEVDGGGRISVTVYNVSTASCTRGATNLANYHLSRGHYTTNFFDVFKWREINHKKETKA